MIRNCPGLALQVTADATVVRFTGDRVMLDAQAVPRLGERLVALADGPGQGPLVLDFGGVVFLSTLVLSTLLRLHRTLEASGRRLCIRNVRPEIYEVFEVTRLTLLLDVQRA